MQGFFSFLYFKIYFSINNKIKIIKTKRIKVFIYQEIQVKDYYLKIGRGKPLPLGANFIENGINFSVYSSLAERIHLVLFESGKEPPFIEIELDPVLNKTGHIWHIYIEGLPGNVKYGYRAFGEFNPKEGKFFNPKKVLFDPYSLALSGGAEWGKRFKRKGNYYGYQRRSFVVKSNFDWQDDRQLARCYADTIIYETHVRGFTIHPSSGVKSRGTFKGLIEKLPYLKELGITAIELMPIMEFDELENINKNPKTGERLYNYWGYSTLAFFAPKASYAESGIRGGQVDEFKLLVKKAHEYGIEIILDVVFNHTGEGASPEVIYSFKGLDAKTYYMIDDNGNFLNFSGCGNTVNSNHPVVRNFIIDVLRYWVTEMHVDGFRFDLASILSRDEKGNVLPNPPVIEQISKDPVLSKTKIIAEAWDAAGLYQVGNFPGERWAEWNGKFRDDVRRFVKGDYGVVRDFVNRLLGSPDLYKPSGREPVHSINFITAHDGFTLWDLVSYNDKHNWENGEENRDGDNNNNSFNYGVEGETDDTKVLKIRKRQVKNFMTILFLSQGTPMMLGGDEFLRTQKGNNNAYCQDNEISWYNWEFLEKNRWFFEFVKKLIHFRKENRIFKMKTYKEIENYLDISFHGIKLNKPDFSYFSRSIAVLLKEKKDIKGNNLKQVFMIFNFWEKDLFFEIPEGEFFLKIDTYREDNSFLDKEEKVYTKKIKVEPYTIKVLIEKKGRYI